MRSIRRVILADGFALHVNTGILLMVLLDIGNQIHGDIVCQRKRGIVIKSNTPHAVIQADQRARIRVGQPGLHPQIILHIGTHGADKLGG